MATPCNRGRLTEISEPDLLVTPDDRCYARAKREGRLTFTLTSKDCTAPGLIREWAKRAAQAGSPALKVGQAMLDAAAFDQDQAARGSKIPD